MDEKATVQYLLDISAQVHKLMYSLTGHNITQGETEYEQKHIDLTEPYRIEILKGLTEYLKRALFKDLMLLSDVIDSFTDIIENKSDNGKNKQELVKNG